MALSPQQVGTSLGGGYVNTLGGPVDPYYAQADGTPWPSVQAACDAVPNAFRRSRTVIVAGIGEMQWLVGDLSNAGLLPKQGGTPGTGGGIGAAVTLYLRSDGFKIQLTPAQLALGIDRLSVEQIPRAGDPPTGYDTPLSSSRTQAAGIVFAPDSSQVLAINELPGAGSAQLNIQFLDSSNGSESDAAIALDYVGKYYRFQRADGVQVVGIFPSNDQAISL